MKRKNYLMNGIAAIATILLFAQCSGNAGNTPNTTSSNGAGVSSDMKIAFVEIDTLLVQYNFWNDLNMAMVQKEENVRATLNQEARKLEKEMQEFQRKVENNAFVSRERYEQEQARIIKKQQDLQNLQNRLSEELATENQKNNLMLRDSINSFMKEYIKDHPYNMIISNTGFDNLLYADPKHNITQEIVEGLNKKYGPSTANK
ncbi:OmpH family outer membrane protein [Bacteroides sp. 519]|uniref:OmpH family outer membrane protein n=1 Tax=Bacteroides sp. 519 TaxID=2302937 RepID=UPI0013D16269|nr:OmpH family outer membrane protein [Bacteroides sp. 519]NDV58383.1 OmpH family outer membrane protein [Bacteroides sp. 519]